MVSINKTTNNYKPVISILIVLILVSGVAGYFVGAEFNKYKNVVDEFFPLPPDEIYFVAGTIISIDESITLEITSLNERFLPGEKIKTERRIINLNSDTKIVKEGFPESFDEEFLDFPEIPIELSELKLGDRVFVEASENIKTKKEFTAIKIFLYDF